MCFSHSLHVAVTQNTYTRGLYIHRTHLYTFLYILFYFEWQTHIYARKFLYGGDTTRRALYIYITFVCVLLLEGSQYHIIKTLDENSIFMRNFSIIFTLFRIYLLFVVNLCSRQCAFFTITRLNGDCNCSKKKVARRNLLMTVWSQVFVDNFTFPP